MRLLVEEVGFGTEGLLFWCCSFLVFSLSPLLLRNLSKLGVDKSPRSSLELICGGTIVCTDSLRAEAIQSIDGKGGLERLSAIIML